jgi:MoxR-like ATPase
VPTVSQFVEKVVDNVERVIVGKREPIELLMVALLCEGHVLIEDVPGVGKTMLARSIAISMGGEFKRLQCTPDLLPNDVTGVSVFNQQSGGFEFRAGPIFVNLLLADEINRATPRTQSALLEAMQEQQVTVDGVTRPLPRPFLVLATQNPIEYEGTFPLPEAQLDRFLMHLSIGYPSPDDEKVLLRNLRREHPITKIEKVVSGDEILEYQKQIWEVHVDESIEDYIIRLVGSLSLYKTAQALAAVRGRDHVIPDDIKYLAESTLIHRLIVRPEAELRGRTAEVILRDLVDEVPLDLGDVMQDRG